MVKVDTSAIEFPVERETTKGQRVGNIIGTGLSS